MRFRPRVPIAAIVAGLAGLAGCGAGADRPATVVIRYPQAVSESHARMKMTRKFADQLKAASAGRMEVRAFPGGELYGAREAVRSAAVGDVEMAMEPETHFVTFNDAFSALDVPFQFDSAEGFQQFIRETFEPLVAPSLARAGLILVACWDEGPMILAARSRLPRQPEDFGGLKIRTSGHHLLARSWQQLGATTVNIPIHEVYTALQQGVAEAIYTTFNTFVSGKTYEVVPKVMRWPARGVYVWVAHKAFWDGLPSADRSLIQALARQTTDEYNRAIWANYQQLIATVRRAPGGEFHELTATEQDAFSSRLQPLLDEWSVQFAGVLPAGKGRRQ